MKNLLLFISILLFSIACSKQEVIRYYSQTEIPKVSSNIISDVEIISHLTKNDYSKYYISETVRIAVMACTDYNLKTNTETKYLLIGEKLDNSSRIASVDDINMIKSADLSKEKASELLDGLDKVINDWNKKYSNENSKLYEFYCYQNHVNSRWFENFNKESPQISITTERYFVFRYSNSIKGPIATIEFNGEMPSYGDGLFGTDALVFKKLEDIREFKDRIERAVRKI
ncbi:MAG: hypothetical protein K8F60_12705 [Melioribacteraceae bacterium]|nr:hypothetical protein [Melioribacteraceae bacterium]